MKPDLQRMYGATPDSFQQSVASALKKTEDIPMKKYAARTLILAAALIIALMAAAYAAFSSQAADFFGKLYGQDTKVWLEQGEVAANSQSFAYGGVVFTLDEVVYRDNGLYGVGTIRVQDGGRDVLMGEDQSPDAPFGYDIHGEGGRAETAPDGTPTLLETAKDRGGRLLQVRVLPDKVSVDGGPLMTPGVVGITTAPQRDGSLRYSFEMTDALALPKGDSYTLEMYTSLVDISPNGEVLEETRQHKTWQVPVQPLPMETAAAASPQETAAALRPADGEGYQILVPEAYQQSGTMPLYKAEQRDFGAQLNPEWFNQSGIAKREEYNITFNDQAELQWSPEALFYRENEGTFNTLAADAPEQPPQYAPWGALSEQIASLASSALLGWTGEGEAPVLEKTTLAQLTLEDARQQVEELMARFNMQGYTMQSALDMSEARIQALAKDYADRLASGKAKTNVPTRDFSVIPPQEEGFFLVYRKPGAQAGSDSAATHSVSAFVNGRGIARLSMRDMFIQGEVLSTPEALVSPQSVADKLPKEIAASRYPSKVESILSVSLTYSPIQLPGEKGLAFTPVWLVTYQDEEAAQSSYTCWAEFNAVDGSLMGAIFK